MEITRRLQRAWSCFQRYDIYIYDRPGVCLRLKVRMLKADEMETLLYGCVTWSPNKPDYDRLRRVHHCILLRCLRWRKQKRDDHACCTPTRLPRQTPSTLRRRCGDRGYCLAGFVTLMGEGRLPRRVMFGELVGDTSYSERQEKARMVRLEEDKTELGMKFEGWRKAA